MLSTELMGNFSELHIVQDKKIDFYAVICLHRYGRGPAIGGCRFLEYPSPDDAIQDAICLSNAMSYKAAISELPHDGGKGVILQPKHVNDRELFLNRFAEFVDSLGGKYITTIDSGTTQSDMSIMRRRTEFVTGCLSSENRDNNPSTSTAWGVYQGIKAAAKLKYGTNSLKDLHIAIQGVGNVGYRLANLLHQDGVRLTVADYNREMVEQCRKNFNVAVVAPEKIHAVNCDIFSPCALGKVINATTIDELQTGVIAGAANDQLISSDMAQILHNKGIFYIPDYLINAGGLIHLALEMQSKTRAEIIENVSMIADRIARLTDIAKAAGKTLAEVTEDTAERIMKV